MMEKLFPLIFADGGIASATRVKQRAELPAAIRALGFRSPQRVMVLVGGASGISDSEGESLRPLFAILADLAQALNLVVVDGGTDAGVMRMLGIARSSAHVQFSLVGVAALGTVRLPHATASAPGAAALEPHHSHFVFVPGTRWGDESRWISAVASTIANGVPSLTILVNGGTIAWEDTEHSIEAHRPVVVVAGSGRTADELAAASRGNGQVALAPSWVNSDLIHSVELRHVGAQLAKLVTDILSAKE